MNGSQAAALKALGSMLASESGRAILTQNKPANDTPVVATHSEAPLKDVLQKAMQYPPPVVVAIHFAPTGEHTSESVGLLVLSGSQPDPRFPGSDVHPFDVSIDAPIGLLFDAVAASECALGESVRVQISWGQSVTRRPDSLFREDELVS